MFNGPFATDKHITTNPLYPVVTTILHITMVNFDMWKNNLLGNDHKITTATWRSAFDMVKCYCNILQNHSCLELHKDLLASVKNHIPNVIFNDGITEPPMGDKTLIINMLNAPVDYQQCLVKSRTCIKRWRVLSCLSRAKMVKVRMVGEGVLDCVSQTWLDLKKVCQLNSVLVYLTSEIVSADAICHGEVQYAGHD